MKQETCNVSRARVVNQMLVIDAVKNVQIYQQLTRIS